MNSSNVLRLLMSALIIGAALTFGPNVSTSIAQTQGVKESPKDRAAIMLGEWTRARLGVKEYIEAMPDDVDQTSQQFSLLADPRKVTQSN